MLGLVLPLMTGVIGLPQDVLQGLGICAVLMAVYGTCCYGWAGRHWRWLMVGIAFANLLYMCLSLGLVVWLYASLTGLGKVYFALELGIIGVLVYWELRVSGAYSIYDQV
jgi:hypothetical protein